MLSEKRKKLFIAIAETTETDVLLTPWSIVHVLVGGVARKINISLLWWEIAHGAYELKDFIVTQQDKSPELYNSLWNSFGDQLVTTAGWYLAKHGSTDAWFLSLGAYWLLMAGLGERVG